MCGIYITNKLVDKQGVESKLRQIEYRGPDNMGYHKKGDISIGHLRLSILDLDVRSNQPYVYEDYIMTYNGEIYNFKEIRAELETFGYSFETSSDTEVLIKGYAKWGKDILQKLNGMFAFAIYDVLKEEVFCARDRVGVKPFYYYLKDGCFEICSQLGPLINRESELNEEAISIYLDCGYVPSPFSILKNVYKLSPGKSLTFNLKRKTHKIETYWDLKDVKETKITYNDAKKELHDLLKDAVKIRMESDVPLGSFLSGGIDSALVSAIASKVSKTKLNTYTIGFEDKKFDESNLARRFSDVIGSNHIETTCKVDEVLEMLPKLIDVYDEPFADSSALPSLLLNSVTKQNVSVALSGDGGDESFIGYHHFDMLKRFQKIEKIPFFIRKMTSKLNLKNFLNLRSESISVILNAKQSDDFIWEVFTGFNRLQLHSDLYKWQDNYEDYRGWSKDAIQRMADLNIKLWLENDSNVKVDRASMAFSMEIRSPFLDYRIIEFARTLPINYRFNDGVKKRILKDILAEYISPKDFNVPKKGFSIPIGNWIKGELKTEMDATLTDEFLNSVPNLDINKFKSQMKMHMENKFDYSFNIWKLYLLAKWVIRFEYKQKELV